MPSARLSPAFPGQSDSVLDYRPEEQVRSRTNEFDRKLAELGLVEITNANVAHAQSAAGKKCLDDWTEGIPMLEPQVFHNSKCIIRSFIGRQTEGVGGHFHLGERAEVVGMS